jgi:hypothetical protein
MERFQGRLENPKFEARAYGIGVHSWAEIMPFVFYVFLMKGACKMHKQIVEVLLDADGTGEEGFGVLLETNDLSLCRFYGRICSN